MKKDVLYLFVIAFGLFSCNKVEKQVAKVNLTATTNGQAIGLANFYDVGQGKIKMDLEINMPSRADSTVAVHFHEHGDCGNMGENTHGHWNPTGEAHGKWESATYHSGDIGNIKLDKNGNGKVSVTTARWSVTKGANDDIIGRGVIVHGGTDDYTTQPTGNSGPRIGCGVIVAVK